jgi:putative SOS response-associated peptidase YedK
MFTMLTMEPGPDVAPYHNRQIAVLRPGDWAAWLFLTKPEAELLRPMPAGSLDVQTLAPVIGKIQAGGEVEMMPRPGGGR